MPHFSAAIHELTLIFFNWICFSKEANSLKSTTGFSNRWNVPVWWNGCCFNNTIECFLKRCWRIQMKRRFSWKLRLSGKMIFSQFFSFQKIDFDAVLFQPKKLIFVKFFSFSRFIELKPSRGSILNEKTKDLKTWKINFFGGKPSCLN